MGSREQGLGTGWWGFGKLRWLGCLFTASLMAAATEGVEGKENRLSVDVRVFNYAQVPNEILAQAESGAAGICRVAGVEIAWINCNLPEDARCARPLDPTHLGVRILPNIGAAPGATSRTMGFAVGNLASVSLRRVREDAAEFGVQLDAVLGPALAHEIGHLLLEAERHSPTGIMRAHWQREDYERAPRGAFKFTPKQAQAIQAEVRNRLQAQAALELAAAPPSE